MLLFISTVYYSTACVRRNYACWDLFRTTYITIVQHDPLFPYRAGLRCKPAGQLPVAPTYMRTLDVIGIIRSMVLVNLGFQMSKNFSKNYQQFWYTSYKCLGPQFTHARIKNLIYITKSIPHFLRTADNCNIKHLINLLLNTFRLWSGCTTSLPYSGTDAIITVPIEHRWFILVVINLRFMFYISLFGDVRWYIRLHPLYKSSPRLLVVLQSTVLCR